MTDWKKHWNTKITDRDPNNWWVPDSNAHTPEYQQGYRDGYEHGKDKTENEFNSEIDSIIWDLERLKY